MVNMVTCPTGLHPYDADRYKVCPYCGSWQEATRPRGSESVAAPRAQPASRAEPAPRMDAEVHARSAGLPTLPSAPGPAPTEYHGSTKQGVRRVYGWLVVTEGPGRGSALPLYPGTNTIGRGEDQDVRLGFPFEEDTEIGRSSHALIRVDPRTLQFAVAHKDGKNLTYLNDTPIFEPFRLLAAYDRLRIGRTLLMFVPLCGEHFRWDEEDS